MGMKQLRKKDLEVEKNKLSQLIDLDGFPVQERSGREQILLYILLILFARSLLSSAICSKIHSLGLP